MKLKKREPISDFDFYRSNIVSLHFIYPEISPFRGYGEVLLIEIGKLFNNKNLPRYRMDNLYINNRCTGTYLFLENVAKLKNKNVYLPNWFFEKLPKEEFSKKERKSVSNFRKLKDPKAIDKWLESNLDLASFANWMFLEVFVGHRDGVLSLDFIRNMAIEYRKKDKKFSLYIADYDGFWSDWTYSEIVKAIEKNLILKVIVKNKKFKSEIVKVHKRYLELVKTKSFENLIKSTGEKILQIQARCNQANQTKHRDLIERNIRMFTYKLNRKDRLEVLNKFLKY